MLKSFTLFQSCFFVLLCGQHATAVVDLRLFVHGGQSRKGGGCLNDLHVLNTLTLTWTEIKATGISPSPRSNHTMSHVNGKLYLFGGAPRYHYKYGILPDDEDNHMYILDLATQSWIKPVISEIWGTPPRNEPEVSERTPEVRRRVLLVFFSQGGIPTKTALSTHCCLAYQAKYAHTMTAVNTSLILIGGGWSDVYVFNTVTLTWTKPTVFGAALPKCKQKG